MKNLIILSVLLLIAVSGYAQNISGSLNSENASAEKPNPCAVTTQVNTSVDKTAPVNYSRKIAADDNTLGIEKAEAEIESASSVKPMPDKSNAGGPVIVKDKVNTGSSPSAVPAVEKGAKFENLPQENVNTVPEKAGEAL